MTIEEQWAQHVKLVAGFHMPGLNDGAHKQFQQEEGAGYEQREIEKEHRNIDEQGAKEEGGNKGEV